MTTNAPGSEDLQSRTVTLDVPGMDCQIGRAHV